MLWTRRALRVLLAMLFASGTLRAQQSPNDQGGFAPERSYQVGEVDSVDLYSGNLTLRLPLGITYPVGPGLEYGFALTYSSTLWGFLELPGPANDPDRLQTQAVPQWFNAGLGWTLSFGYLTNGSANWLPETNLYFGPDGSMRRFFPTLHEGETPAAGIGYTRDGTYLRLRNLDGSGNRVVEFPDGNRHYFDAQGHLVRMETQHAGVWMSLGAQPAGCSNFEGTCTKWVVTDSKGRRHEVSFSAGRVTSVQTALAGGVPNGAPYASFGLSYAPSGGPIARACPDDVPDNPDTPQDERRISVTFLAGISLPDGSSYGAGPYIEDAPWGINNPDCTKSGLITGLRLPTGGRLDWQWDRYDFPTGQTRPSEPGQRGFKVVTYSAGVSRRRTFDHDGTVLGTWTYDNLWTFPDPHVVNKVIDPLQHVTFNYFIGTPGLEQGLPYTRQQTDGQGRFLSTQVYRNGALVRSTFVRYENDPVGTLPPDLQTNTNRRVASSSTRFDDDGGRAITVDSSECDGLGNYRWTTTSATPAAAWRTQGARTTFTNYNPGGSGVPGCPSGTRMATHRPWVLGTYSEKRVSQGSSTFTTLYCFDDSGNGDLLRTRRLRAAAAPAAASAQDLVTVYSRIAATGEVTAEEMHGADAGGLGTGALCSLPLGAPRRAIDHTYTGGVRASSKYRGASFFNLDRTIDVRTGLVERSRDASGLVTRFEYDALGRFLFLKPAEDAWTSIAYQPPAPGRTFSRVVVRRYPNGNLGAPDLTRQELDFDGLGRVWKERSRRAGVMDEVLTGYDGVGNVKFRSERGTPNSGTHYRFFDPFGRPGAVETADGRSTSLTYFGVREVQRRSKVLVEDPPGTVSERDATTIERYDQQGQLWQVVDPVGLAATYSYDAMDHLVLASLVGNGTTQERSFGYDGLGLLRWENHPEKDNNGYNPPGSQAGTDVDYLDYDVLGNAGRTVDGPNELVHSFDEAGRPTRTTWARFGNTRFAAPRPLLTLSYGTSQSYADPTGLSNGKLIQARRHNYAQNGASEVDVQIAYDYVYGGRSGRLSRRNLVHGYIGDIKASSLAEPGASFTQSWSYDQLGNVTSIGYPQCTFHPCDLGNGSTAIFSDVPVGHPYRQHVEAIYRAGVTGGCGPGVYCPNNTVTRAETAVFLLRSIEGPSYQPPACTTPIFPNDVPCGYWAAAWINEIARRGLTAGCGAGSYCPDDPVARWQMAVFLLRAEHGASYQPPACTGGDWTDVPCSYFGAPWIEVATRQNLISGCTSTAFCPDQAPNRAEMAKILTEGFRIPLAVSGSGTSPRTVQQTYVDGLLTAVTGYAALAYHPNRLVQQIAMSAGPTWTQHVAAHNMPRPSRIALSFGPFLDYEYDGTGNVTRVGDMRYVYDYASRVRKATTGTGLYQSYSYDDFGNLQSLLSNYSAFGRNAPTSAANNRLLSGLYDTAGNLLYWNGAQYAFDALNKMRRVVNGEQDWQHVYDPNGERVLAARISATGEVFYRWTLRGLDNRVLRTWELNNWAWGAPSADSVWAGGRLLATEEMSSGIGRRWHFTDHLGTPRVIWDQNTGAFTEHHYLAFGEETTNWNDRERHKFTGHERDSLGTSGVADDLDYMHARFFNPLIGRFLSTDRAAADPSLPATWNRYSYVANNPLRFVDPDGNAAATFNIIEKFTPLFPLALPYNNPGSMNKLPGWTSWEVPGVLELKNGSTVFASTVRGDDPKAGFYQSQALPFISHTTRDTISPFATNCVGSVFAQGSFWINPQEGGVNQVATLIESVGGKQVTDGSREVGDIVVYQNAKGEVIHVERGLDAGGHLTYGQDGMESNDSVRKPGEECTGCSDPRVTVTVYRPQ